ncbi:MAG: Uma2 family endonuclease [Candidatus Sericytochromatia bacterium]|nr:Uma2 family endonuclease [Candidatus Tanganyikabacteria bacterium]
MATQSHRKFMTYEEFEALPREGMITMLLDGEYVVLVSPTKRHQRIIGRLHLRLGNFLEAHPELGEVYLAPLDVVLSREARRVIQPDIFFISRERRDRAEGTLIEGMPDLAIEVLSRDANRYDKGKKLQYYDEYDTSELWHVWQDKPKIEVFRRDAAGRLRLALEVGRADLLQTPLLPGFELDTAALYRDLL